MFYILDICFLLKFILILYTYNISSIISVLVNKQLYYIILLFEKSRLGPSGD